MDDCLESPMANKYSLRKKLKLPILLKALKINKNDTLLDVGCGAGVFSQEMALYGGKVIGLDYSDTNVRAVRERYKLSNLSFEVGDAANMPFKNEMFDSILATEIIEHIEDDNKFVSECYRVLKKSGKVVITSPCTNPTISVDWMRRLFAGIDITKDFGHKRGGYTKDELFNILRKNNFEPIKVVYYDLLFGEIAWVITCMPRALTNKNWKSGEGQDKLGSSFMFNIYKVIFPLIYGFAKLDFFLKGLRGHHIMVVGRKN
mgnify:FL=1